MKRHTIYRIIGVVVIGVALGLAIYAFLFRNYGTFDRPLVMGGPETSVVHKQFNFHGVAPGVWRSSQPSVASLDRMRAYGLKSIVNLRKEGEAEGWEAVYAAQHGLQYFHRPMDARQKQDPVYLEEILSLMREPANQPVLIHCASGKDRTGLIAALYKMQTLGTPREELAQEMLMYGYDEKNYPELFKIFREISRKETQKNAKMIEV